MSDVKSIQQAADATGLSADTLRYYERIGLVTDVKRASNGHRVYRPQDIQWLLFLKQLRATGMSISQMQHFAELRRGGDDTVSQRRVILEEYRGRLESQIEMIQAFISLIDFKIERHRQREETFEEIDDA